MNEKPTLQDLENFFTAVEAIRKGYKGNSGHGNHTPEWYESMGCSKATLEWLKKNHFVTWHTKGEHKAGFPKGVKWTADSDVCIMYKNPLYKTQTYARLKAVFDEMKEEEETLKKEAYSE